MLKVKSLLFALVALFGMSGFSFAATTADVRISGSYTKDSTSFTFNSTDASNLLDPANQGPYPVTFFNSTIYTNPTPRDPDYEICLVVTKTSSTVYVLTRAQSGTKAIDHPRPSARAAVIKVRLQTDAATATPTSTFTSTYTPTNTPTNTPTVTPTPILVSGNMVGIRIIDSEWVQLTASQGLTIAASNTSKQFQAQAPAFVKNQTMAGFRVNGKRTSAGNTATLIAQMYFTTSAATTAVGPPVTIAGTSTAAISTSSYFTYPHAVLPADVRNYFVNFTGTTAASTTLEVDGIDLLFWSTPYPTPTP